MEFNIFANKGFSRTLLSTAFLFFLFSSLHTAYASASFNGPTGFARTPNSKVLNKYSWALSLSQSNYEYIPTGKKYAKGTVNLGYGAFENGEFGLVFNTDSQADTDNNSPCFHGKYRFPGNNSYFGNSCAGFIFDPDGDDYSSVYLMFGPVGFGFNMGGKRTNGRALLGGCDHEIRQNPTTGLSQVYSVNAKTAFVLLGYELPIGDKGLSLLAEYNGDCWGGGLRYRYGDFFTGDIFAQAPGTYWHLDRLNGLGYRQNAITLGLGFSWAIW